MVAHQPDVMKVAPKKASVPRYIAGDAERHKSNKMKLMEELEKSYPQGAPNLLTVEAMATIQNKY